MNFGALEKSIGVLEKSLKFVSGKGYEPFIKTIDANAPRAGKTRARDKRGLVSSLASDWLIKLRVYPCWLRDFYRSVT